MEEPLAVGKCGQMMEENYGGFSCYVEDELVLFLNVDQVVSWCLASTSKAQVVGGHIRINETIPTSASLFVRNVDMCQGYRIDFIQTVQKALCFLSSHICKFLCTKHLCNS